MDLIELLEGDLVHIKPNHEHFGGQNGKIKFVADEEIVYVQLSDGSMQKIPKTFLLKQEKQMESEMKNKLKNDLEQLINLDIDENTEKETTSEAIVRDVGKIIGLNWDQNSDKDQESSHVVAEVGKEKINQIKLDIKELTNIDDHINMVDDQTKDESLAVDNL